RARTRAAERHARAAPRPRARAPRRASRGLRSEAAASREGLLAAAANPSDRDGGGRDEEQPFDDVHEVPRVVVPVERPPRGADEPPKERGAHAAEAEAREAQHE